MIVSLREILQVAENRLATLGFAKVKPGLFIRSQDDRFSGWLGLNRAGGSGTLEINPVIGVRSHEVEQIVAEHLRLRGPKNLVVPTISTSLGYLLPQGTYVPWIFREECDVEKGIEDLMDAVRLFGLPFITEFSSLSRLVDGLQSSKLADADSKRLRLPVALILVGEHEKAASLLNRYLAEMGERSDDLAIEYRRFAAALRRDTLPTN